MPPFGLPGQPGQLGAPQQQGGGQNPAALALIGAALVQHAHQQALAQAGQNGLHLGLNHQPGVAPGLAHAPGQQQGGLQFQPPTMPPSPLQGRIRPLPPLLPGYPG